MHTLIVTFVVAVSMLATFSRAVPLERVKRQNLQGLVIPREFQNINFEKYLENPRAVQFQLKCVIYNGPCDSIGKYLKSNFPNWLKTQCKNCSPSQKKQAGKAIEFFQTQYPVEWNDAVKKYRGAFDEDDIRRFQSELGINVPLEAAIPIGGAPKPNGAALAAFAKQAIADAKTTPEPLVFESRTTGGRSVSESSSTTAAPTSEASTTSTTTEAASSSSSPSSSSPAAETTQTETSTPDAATTAA